MTMQRLFVQDPIPRQPLGKGIPFAYGYDGQLLTIFEADRVIAQRSAVSPGDAFLVTYDAPDPPKSKSKSRSKKRSSPPRRPPSLKLTTLKTPLGNDDLLMWLLGFNWEDRHHSKTEYLRHLSEQRMLHRWSRAWSWERSIEGTDYAFTYCGNADGSIICYPAAYVRGADKDMVKEVLLKWCYLDWPRPYVERLLKSRFNFQTPDLAEVQELQYHY